MRGHPSSARSSPPRRPDHAAVHLAAAQRHHRAASANDRITVQVSRSVPSAPNLQRASVRTARHTARNSSRGDTLGCSDSGPCIGDPRFPLPCRAGPYKRRRVGESFSMPRPGPASWSRSAPRARVSAGKFGSLYFCNCEAYTLCREVAGPLQVPNGDGPRKGLDGESRIRDLSSAASRRDGVQDVGRTNFSGGVRVPARNAARPASKSSAEPTKSARSSGAP